MAFSTFSGSNSGNRAFQLNGEILGGVVVSGTLFGGLPVFTGSTDGIPIAAHAKYALSRSFADNDASGSIIQALNYLEARAGLSGDVTFVNVNNALQESTGSILLGDPSRTDTISGSGPINIVGAGFLGSLITTGSISSSAGSLIIGGGTTLTGLLDVSGVITAAGNISSSAALMIGGATTLTNTLDVSGAATIVGTTALRGRLNVTGNISGTADVAGQALKIQAGAILTGALVQHGGTTLQGELSSSGGAVFLGTVITNTFEASSSLLVAGNAGVTGTVHAGSDISGAADIAGQELKIQAGSTITGSSVFHGAISGGLGATFVEGVIASTLEASSSIFCGASVVVTGASGFVMATSMISNQTILASTSMTGVVGLNLGGESLIRIHNNIKEPVLNVSGTIFVSGAASANPIKLQLGTSAASCSLDMIPYIQTMGVDEAGKLKLFKLQISGGMFQVSEA